ncbi:MAG: response regulator transcription factor [Hydrococcus sp. SU_1_0]|nr:response regulator transcription factor [Hydrococcus sp. SU_1_0]
MKWSGRLLAVYEAIKYLEQSKVDVALVDLEMPEMNGLKLTSILSERFSATKTIILSSHDDEDNINSAVEAGARGYLLKNTSAQEIGDTIRAVQRGYFQLGPGLFEKLLSHFIQEQEESAENILKLQSDYEQSLLDLEQKIVAQNEQHRNEMYQELEFQVLNLKQDFRQGLDTFQAQVSKKLQTGIEAASAQLNRSAPDSYKIEMQIDQRNFRTRQR